MQHKNLITLVIISLSIVALCVIDVIHLQSQQPEPIVSSESVADEHLTANINWDNSEDLASMGRLIEEGINPFGYWDEGESHALEQQEAGEAPARERAVQANDPSIVCAFNQVELDDLLTKMNELFNNIFIVAQAIADAGVTLPNTELAVLLLNANTPQDVGRTCRVLVEKVDYLQRLSIVLANDIFTVIPPSAEQSAREEAVV